MIRFAVQAELLPAEGLARRWQLAQRLGFEALELSGPAVADARAAADGDVPVSALVGGHRGWLIDPDPELVEQCIADIAALLPVAAALDAPVVVVPAYGYTNRLPRRFGTGRSPDDDRALFGRGLERLARDAERAGAQIAIEPLNRYETPVCNTVAEALQLADSASSPAVAVMADVFHMNIEEADSVAALVDAGDRLAYVHLADSNRLEPGAGHVDFAAVFAALSAMRYDGTAALECGLSGDPEATLRTALQSLRNAATAAYGAVA